MPLRERGWNRGDCGAWLASEVKGLLECARATTAAQHASVGLYGTGNEVQQELQDFMDSCSAHNILAGCALP